MKSTCIRVRTSEFLLPDTVVPTGEAAFSGCTALKEVVYAGTEEDQEKIRIGRRNEPLHSARRA